MKPLFAIVMAVFGAFFFHVQHAYAFQESEVAVTAPERSTDGQGLALKQNLSAKQKGAAALADVHNNSNYKKKQGRTLYIPGFGTIGTLPQLDFGLELLYQDEELRASERAKDDDLAIKGRIKHKF